MHKKEKLFSLRSIYLFHYDSNIPKPVSEWHFIRWDENRGKQWGNNYINVNAICEDQFCNKKSVNARTFQTGWFIINEVEAGRGIPDSGEDLSDTATATNSVIDSINGLVEAHSRAITCGSMSNYECFNSTERTLELGKKLCGQ